jgi:hypothetical protein
MPERKRKEKKSSKRFNNSVFNAFKQEFFIGFLFILGVFLLVEDMDIKIFVYNFIVSSAKNIVSFFNAIVGAILEFFRTFESSDIVGYILIASAFFLFIIRIRNKAIMRYTELDVCPDCGSELHRVHRNSFQKTVGVLLRLKVSRYSCKSCDFDGLRLRPIKSR